MEVIEKNSKLKNVSLAMISGYIAEHIENGFSRFLHDFTNTEYIQTDLTPGIISAMIANASIELMNKKNIIYTSFFATGLIYAIITIYNEIVKNEKIGGTEFLYRFIYDASFITIILFYYNKMLKYIKQYQKNHYKGDIHHVIKNVIATLPISLYFGYRQFVSNLESQSNKEKN